MNTRVASLANNRLQELAEQAGLYVDMNGTPWPKSLGVEEAVAAYQKFAELIVRECIRVPYDMWDKAELNADVAVKIEHRIKEHFGIENEQPD